MQTITSLLALAIFELIAAVYCAVAGSVAGAVILAIGAVFTVIVDRGVRLDDVDADMV